MTAYQSASSFFAHLFSVGRHHGTRVPSSNLPLLATILGVTATAVALVVTVWLGRRGRADTAVGAAVATGVLVLGLAQEYHFAMLLGPGCRRPCALVRWRAAPGP